VRCGRGRRCLEAYCGTVPSVASALPPRHLSSSLKSSLLNLTAICTRSVFLCHNRQVLIAIQSSRERWHMRGGCHSLDWSSPREIEPPVGSVDVFSVLFSLLFSFCKGLAPCVRQAGGLLYGLISSSYHFLPAEFMHCTCRHTLLSDLSTAEAVSGVLNPDDRICSN